MFKVQAAFLRYNAAPMPNGRMANNGRRHNVQAAFSRCKAACTPFTAQFPIHHARHRPIP
ncbi:hypothetical protein HMPREF9098_1206 [Kingella denitrificans ATCC 33394]|uniref:Uncharacterized protein n=1 Tax=Kingella denitrificans ATCC 33394 TaxID=888741 RepID=F0EZC2_9NEIS|nr:hypothetical protein HMPREF9098_1206 [Kingella denitrificans ATCC 33394]